MSSFTRVPHLLIAPVVVALLLTGCGGGEIDDSAQTATATLGASSSASPTPAPASADTLIDGVGVGTPYADALSSTGAAPVAQACPHAAIIAKDGMMIVVERAADGDDRSPVNLVAVSAPAEASGVIGPRTPEGIGIGSTVTEARAAYPGLEEPAPAGMGDRRYLMVDTGGAGDTFFTYTEGEERIWEYGVTSLAFPPYEPCA